MTSPRGLGKSWSHPGDQRHECGRRGLVVN